MKMILHTALSLLAATQAQAVCPSIQRAYSYKMKEYRAYREENLKAYASLVKRETQCKLEGASVSGTIAGSAAALSCEALADASRLNAKVETVGVDCASNFSKLNLLQVELKRAFLVVQGDLEDSVEYMHKSKVLREFCPTELELGAKMVKAFLKLEGDIVHVETRSLAGKVDYGKFAAAATQLKTMSAATNRNCRELKAGEDKGAGRRVASTYAAGAAVPAGKSPRSYSDITGTEPKK